MPAPADAPSYVIVPDALDVAMPTVPDATEASSVGGASSSAGPLLEFSFCCDRNCAPIKWSSTLCYDRNCATINFRRRKVAAPEALAAESAMRAQQRARATTPRPSTRSNWVARNVQMTQAADAPVDHVQPTPFPDDDDAGEPQFTNDAIVRKGEGKGQAQARTSMTRTRGRPSNAPWERGDKGGPYRAAPQWEPRQDWGQYRGPLWNRRAQTMSNWPQPGAGEGQGKTYTRTSTRHRPSWWRRPISTTI
jgi:hypothetical protein